MSVERLPLTYGTPRPEEEPTRVADVKRAQVMANAENGDRSTAAELRAIGNEAVDAIGTPEDLGESAASYQEDGYESAGRPSERETYDEHDLAPRNADKKDIDEVRVKVAKKAAKKAKELDKVASKKGDAVGELYEQGQEAKYIDLATPRAHVPGYEDPSSKEEDVVAPSGSSW